jgi:hypothetical protein
MSAVGHLLSRAPRPGSGAPLKVLSASGQLGYGIPEKALKTGMERQPHFMGCDMGSVDPGPYYLGSGKMATADPITRRDIRMVLSAARQSDIPLVIGTAGTAGAGPHLEATRRIIHEIAREEGLSFRMAVIHADMPRDFLKSMAAAGRTRPLGRIAELNAATIDRASHIVGQIGTEAFVRALDSEPDVILAGRACDTAIFAAIPEALGYPLGPTVHMAKIVECTSICCVPGGRDAMLATLEGDSFVLESMHPGRAATPVSVAAHTLYEQADPLRVDEPGGWIDVASARFEAVDERRTRVSGAVWHPRGQMTVKVEGAEWCGERGVLLAGSCDPRVIENTDSIIAAVRAAVADIVQAGPGQTFELYFRVFGKGAISLFPETPLPTPGEIFFLVEAIGSDEELVHAALTVAKQSLLHLGFPGRLSTGGNIAFAFTPPELTAAPAYRFSIYHVAECDDMAALFPVEVETVGSATASRTAERVAAS